MNALIPKVIHYCWFGRNKKSKSVLKCIQSWKKYCPDYEIIEWNEDNFDVNCIPFVKEAYDAEKWAFVTDYARLKIIFENGGIYNHACAFKIMADCLVDSRGENAVKSAIQEQIEAQPVQQQTIPTFPTNPGAGENAQETGAATPGE